MHRKPWLSRGNMLECRVYPVQGLVEQLISLPFCQASPRIPRSRRYHSLFMTLVEGLKLNLPKMLEQKDTAVATLVKGIEGLFKKNGVLGVWLTLVGKLLPRNWFVRFPGQPSGHRPGRGQDCHIVKERGYCDWLKSNRISRSRNR